MKFDQLKMEKTLETDILLKFHYDLLIQEGKTHENALLYLYENQVMEDPFRANAYQLI